MSLKQRAVQCSGHIPADQYVPVYSRPYRTNHARWHEEIAPITPRPTLDDAFDDRKHSIHEAVKQWLESSPNSVIGPLYRTRSPSAGSPHLQTGSRSRRHQGGLKRHRGSRIWSDSMTSTQVVCLLISRCLRGRFQSSSLWHWFPGRLTRLRGLLTELSPVYLGKIRTRTELRILQRR